MKFFKNWILLLAVVALSGGMAACKKGELGTVSFDVSQQATFVIPHSTLLDLPEIFTPGVSTNWQADFSNHNTNKDNLRELKLKNLTLNITNPPGKTWKFMKSIEVYIKADGLDETKIAYIDNIPENVGQSLTLTPIDVDLKPYAQKDNFTLRMNTKLAEANNDDVDVRADMVFRVTANVLE